MRGFEELLTTSIVSILRGWESGMYTLYTLSVSNVVHYGISQQGSSVQLPLVQSTMWHPSMDLLCTSECTSSHSKLFWDLFGKEESRRVSASTRMERTAHNWSGGAVYIGNPGGRDNLWLASFFFFLPRDWPVMWARDRDGPDFRAKLYFFHWPFLAFWHYL